jgi:DNA-binding transcriptional LysR family regulator
MKKSADIQFPQKSQEMVLLNLERSLKNLRVADVELFITAAHMKSLGKSAHHHHLSQSATSTAIRRVEAAFGIALCTHEKRHFSLTHEGAMLLPKLESWLRLLRDLISFKDHPPIRLVTTHAIAQIAAPAILAAENIHFQHKRPDQGYAAILNGNADLALVLDNAPWKGVVAKEIAAGEFRLYSTLVNAPIQPVLLPEDQIEVLALQQSWQQKCGYPLPVKSRIPSWSLIANICSESNEVGFLPDFLGEKLQLHPVSWQPKAASYRILALYKSCDRHLQARLDTLIHQLQKVFRR